MFPGLCVSARWCNLGPGDEGAVTSPPPPNLWEQSVHSTDRMFWLLLPHCLPVSPSHSFLLPAFIPFLPHFPPSLPPYQFHSPFFPSSHSHPHSLYTWGSCSFIANWTFHSERNNYSLERKGTAVECWYDTQCHLATQELPAHPTHREAEGTGQGGARVMRVIE